MTKKMTLHAQFDSAFDNYLTLTKLLQADLEAMLSHESNALHWRRNFVRASAALLEAHAHCLRQMCIVALKLKSATITSKERSVILDESSFDTNNRLRLTLRAAYKLFALEPLPNFGDSEWKIAQRVMKKRHKLMHPKNPQDLGMSDSTWRVHKRGIKWLMKQFFDFLSLSQMKYGS